MAGFMSPSILFLSTWDTPERGYLSALLPKLRAAGYKHYHEPAVGGFAMPLVALDAGYDPRSMTTSDVHLFTGILGTLLSGGDFEDLEVRYDDRPIDFSECSTDVDKAALLLYTQYLARIQTKPEGEYWKGLCEDLERNSDYHKASFRDQLARMAGRIGGLAYRSESVWEHMDRIADDPHAVIVSNPPTYKCLGVDERILTADLRWVRAGDIVEGQSLTAFDEYAPEGGRRRLRTATVTHSETVMKDCVRVHLADGSSVVCTTDHPWLVDAYEYTASKRRWIEARDVEGSWALRMLRPWETDLSRDGGWLAGLYDGEGNLNWRDGSHSLVFTQVPGGVQDRFEEVMTERGFSFSVHRGRGKAQPVLHSEISSVPEILRALGSLRPQRLLDKWTPDGGFRTLEKVQVTSVEPLGPREVQSIETSTRTYIGEGWAMHNSAYEKFFDTKGLLTWKTPDYDIFEAPTDIPEMVRFMEGRKALLVVQQQQTPRNSASPNPPYARQLSEGQLVYINSNRCDEVVELAGGKTAVPRKMSPRASRPWPMLPEDYEVRPDSEIRLACVESKYADAYRAEWMHRLSPVPGSNNVLVFIDGYAAGVIGYSLASISSSYSDKWSKHAILRFAFGATHNTLRMTRLATMLSLQHDTLWLTKTPLSTMQIAAAQGLVTVEMTRHPEAKGLRGLMTLDNRQKHPDGFKLVYASDWKKAMTPQEVLAEFLRKEQQWRKSTKRA